MRRIASTSIMIFFFLLLTGCLFNRPSYLETDLTQENWRQAIEVNPSRWLKGADCWFLTGKPNLAEQENRTSPLQATVSLTNVKVPNDFTHVIVDGAFQVQIFQTDGPNTVYVYGPSVGVRATAVDVHRKTLCIRQTQVVPAQLMKRVIVRIGVKCLNNLTQMGCGSIEAVRIKSNNLRIWMTSKACGDIYLAGSVNLKCVDNAGGGSIYVFGACTPHLEIRSSGTGSVNVAGWVGIRSIKHCGCGDINIVGANGGPLTIITEGKGKIGLSGLVALKEVIAKDNTCVYLSAVNGGKVTVILSGHASVGMAGCAKNLIVKAAGASTFFGRDLCGDSAYVCACDTAHINVTARCKIFASAAGNSSIFFYGPNNLLSTFSREGGAIIPMGRVSWCNYASEYRSYSYTYAHPGESVIFKDQVRRKQTPMNYKGE